MFRTIVKIAAILSFLTSHPLSKNRKLKVIGSFVRWQIGERILKNKVIFPWVDESRFITGRGETGLTGNIYVGLMEYESMAFLLHTLRPTDVFVDVGANAGAYTILASKAVGARSVAFEPLPEAVGRLGDQLRINGVESLVDVHAAGVGDRKTTLFFTKNNDTMNKVSVSGNDADKIEIDVTTLDDELDTNTSYFIKIDVEGFEHHVLEGASRILSSGNVLAMIVELNGSTEAFGHSNEEVHRKIGAFGFVPIAYDPETRTVRRLDGYNRNDGNTLYIRDEAAVSDRCKTARPRVIHTAGGMAI